MRKITTLLTLTLLSAAAGAAQAQDPELTPEAKALMEKVSVAYGTRLAQDLRADGLYLDIDKFAEAFRAISEGKDPLMDPDTIKAAFGELQTYMVAQQSKAQTDFLAENGKKEGVKTTESGLQYEVITAAEGPKPKATDQVTVHYTGTLIDGTKFDSSVDRGEPATFGLNQVIPGWTEGVQLMSKGSKFRFTIPHTIGYGERGSPPKIPPYATLVFDIELLGIDGQ